jgi:hypothetical protein
MNIFEERIVCFEGESVEVAFRKASAESKKYAAENGFQVHPERESYEQDGEAVADGQEVWSTLFEARESLDDFYTARYRGYDYHPE